MASTKYRPSLLGGLIWTGFGLLFLLRNIGIGPDIWGMIGRYWPVLLILLGLGKVIDYYRGAEGVSLRFGEIFGLFLLLVIGSAISRVSDSSVGDLIWRTPIHIGGSDVRLGNSYSYSEESSFAISPDTPLAIENSYGSVSVSPGGEGELRVRLRKVVFAGEESRAKEIAEEIKLEGRPQGAAEASTFLLKTNRESLASREHRFETDMEVFVPKKVQLRIDSSFGAITVAGLEGKLEASTTQKPLEVRDFVGDVAVSSRYADLRLENITGNVQVEARGRVEIQGVRGEVKVRNEYSPVVVERSDGPVSITNTESSITVEEIAKPVTIDARGSQVTARNLSDSLKVATSHRRVRLSEIASQVDLDCRYATVTMEAIRGDVSIVSNSDRINLEDLAGTLTVKAKGSGVRANGVKGAVDIESSMKEVVVNDFGNACSIKNEYADISLSAPDLSRNNITVQNRNGGIDLFLPAGAAFEVDATARAGRITSGFPELKVEPGGGEVAVLKGRLKSGGPVISLQTEYGKISLQVYRDRKSSN
ncbi:MAG: DUF4097 domain-containing protein [Acidobacteria bacterium]|nr:DUF4097 domain-containing protein [Acidobacteriota bacterium]